MTRKEWINNVEEYYLPCDTNICVELENMISRELDAGGLLYRIFSRAKERGSVLKKIQNKIDEYIREDKKLQDAIGIRIVLYFADDIDICINILKRFFRLLEVVYDRPDTETFRPQRINTVFELPKGMDGISKEIRDKCRIDNTIEIQIRTIFSEGWHEVEHDLHNKYKKQSWEAMIRNRFRLRFSEIPLSKEIIQVLNTNIEIGKKIFRFNRTRLVKLFSYTKIDIVFDNAVYLINHFDIQNKEIDVLMPAKIKEMLSAVGIVDYEDGQNNFPYNSIVYMIDNQCM